ncbi:MAG: SUMF1/EgtB/PvdO family nonheme iron enzyme [Pseudomonadota bacterium]
MVHPKITHLLEDFVPIAGGKILIKDEGTQTSWPVALHAFRISHIPVTNDIFRQVLKDFDKQGNVPVTDISWADAVRFCNATSEVIGAKPCYTNIDDNDCFGVQCDFNADGVRLPTEAEWEFACRAGSNDTRYGELDAIAWYRENSSDHVHPVAEKVPNALGLFDMIGNVWEWCWDIYDVQRYGPYRVFRGGGFADLPRGCRASCRRKSHPRFAAEDVGFRLAAGPTQEFSN